MATRLLLVIALLTACSEESREGENLPTDTGTAPTEVGVCVSGDYWTGGNQESPLMNPGGNCIGCHTRSSEGPAFTIAGTVYTNVDEPRECNGESSVEVEITDDLGNVFTTTTNAAGNFFFTKTQADPVFPISALVRWDGQEVAMVTGQMTGNCASCHTAAGKEGAAGRIVVP